jgi:protein-L-isoaspartate(D-aspartate) O-methyltransferase
MGRLHMIALLDNSQGNGSSRAVLAAARRLRLVADLERRGISDRRVLLAIGAVPRERFVPGRYRDLAYADTPLPIGYGQTISQPFTVAFMCQAVGLRGHERVLEIGTGSGYGAAVLSQLARRVYTVERLPDLAARAQAVLGELEYDNISLRCGDGSLGLPEEAPFDAIVVTAAAETLPETYPEQLVEGGRLVIPLGPEGGPQTLYRFTRRSGQLEAKDLGAFAFVPLVGHYGSSEF